MGPYERDVRAMMITRRTWAVIAALACCAALAACSSGDSASKHATATAQAGPSADSSGTDWQSYGHDLANTRYNPDETAVNAGSVAKLKPAWSKDKLIGVTGTPVVSNGIVYFGDWLGTVWAVDATSGAPVWTTKVGGQFIGSPAISGDTIFVGSGKTLYALDLKTGVQRWSAVTNDNNFSQINSSPVVVDSLVIEGTAQFEEVVGNSPFTFRGSIGAWDARTGKQVWNLYTTPNDATSGAGAGIWGTPAVSTRLGLLFIGTGPSLSEPTGPLADALLAIDYKTGELKWSHQFTTPDIFSRASGFSGPNADIGASPNLWTDGGRDVIGVGSKNGTYYALDATTGDIIWETEMSPGSVFGGALGSAAFADGMVIASSNIGNGKNGQTNTTKVLALDPTTGKIAWSMQFDGNIFGPISTVDGVAFVGTTTNTMLALDVKTGATLWSHRAPGQIGGGAAIVDGQVLWGYGFTLFSGSGDGGIIAFNLDGSAPATP